MKAVIVTEMHSLLIYLGEKLENRLTTSRIIDSVYYCPVVKGVALLLIHVISQSYLDTIHRSAILAAAQSITPKYLTVLN